ncbi:MAG: leucine--tRNA ligase [bacterium]|nr:leucine--tRNA ligase [bacterium]
MFYPFQKIEKKWRALWDKNKIYEPDFKKAQKPFYNLMMFPYPSAEGLHVGNMYAFVGSDIYGRLKRMQGYDVFEPIGLDGFGIHSENYALKIKAHPMEQAKVSEKRFYEQLSAIGNGFAWDEHLETYDPEYYKWTQWIFVQMFKNGLVYRKKQAVNWCLGCKTVLADEQVISGECERCSSKVIKKELEQWFFKITKYAEQLLENLEKIDWSEKIKIAQKEWIGKSEGAEIDFSVKDSEEKIKVFTTRPDTLFGATYMVLAPEHELISNLKSQISNIKEVGTYIKKAKEKSDSERIEFNKEKTGVELKGIKAINPANKKEIPVFAADYVLSTYGTGAIMAVPAHDERDFEFARRYELPVVEVVAPLIYADRKQIDADNNIGINRQNQHKSAMIEPYISEGILVNSGRFDGMPSEKAGWEITKLTNGKKTIQYHLRDWLISRQRYWGAPIPMIYCEACAKLGKGDKPEMPGWYAALEKDLPVVLPYVKDFRPKGTGESPLAADKKFYEVKCPECGKTARRETDVSDTFLDSAWYYLRYPSVSSGTADAEPWNPEITKKWFPVNLYTGGAEHSVLHLLYVRFAALALHDLKLLDFGPSEAPRGEPFPKFRSHGLLIKDGAKMSKSKGNVVNPDEYIKKFGADALRMYLMFLAPFEQGGDFRDEAIMGIVRFLERVWELSDKKEVKDGWKTKEIILQKTIKKITEDIENLKYNTAISELMKFIKILEEYPDKNNFEIFLKLLAPFAPFIAEELWRKLGHKKSIHLENWPEYNPQLIKEDKFELIIQVNGKFRDKVSVPQEITEKEAEELAVSQEKIKNCLKDKKIVKTIFVAGKLINLVVN